MKVLIIGGGGREHALAWKLKRCPSVQKVWCAPGNAGIAQDAECVAADSKDLKALIALAERLQPDLTVVGPELPLVAGIADEFATRGWRILGPSKRAAQLEGSKVFAKEFLTRHGIATAAPYGIFDSPGDAYSALCAVDWPVVVKADGLCAGKGVLVTASPDEATDFIERVMEKREFGESGSRILIEEALEGQELSYIVLTDGNQILPMVPTRDHKRAFDGNLGPNTGGMGAYSAEGILPREQEEQILATIVRPAIADIAKEGALYRGFLYFGLMLTPEGPKVLEFNCRLGDPEAQAIIPRMDFDAAELLAAVADGKLENGQISWRPGASVCVVATSGGYPGDYQVNKRIDGLDQAAAGPGVIVFHAATKREGDIYYTNGGRVLGVTAIGDSLETAARSCYDCISKIRFEGMHFRTDIGLERTKSAEQTAD